VRTLSFVAALAGSLFVETPAAVPGQDAPAARTSKTTLTLSEQSLAKPPAFEVASIKPRARGGARGSNPVPAMNLTPGRLSFVNVNLRACIEAAYGIPGEGRPDYRLTGEPDWLGSQRYDIEARAERPVGNAELLQMLQTLLADRFKLRVGTQIGNSEGFR
jgi:uncharacterized protein (TIGR03435 family)